MSLEEATAHCHVHVHKGAAWSGNTLLYLNAMWDSLIAVVKEEGFDTEE